MNNNQDMAQYLGQRALPQHLTGDSIFILSLYSPDRSKVQVSHITKVLKVVKND